MEELNPKVVEETILNVLGTVTRADISGLTMETPLTEVGLKSIQLISVSALLDEKLGIAPNFRTLIGMETIGQIRDYILR